MENLFVQWQHCEAQNSFSVLTESQVDSLELLVFLGIDGLVFAFKKHPATILPYFLWSSLDVCDIVMIRTFLSYHREGIFVGGVERHLCV